MIERDRGHSLDREAPEHPPASLTFTIHGRLTSANAIKLPQVRGKRAVMIKTREAKEDAERILELATAAVKQSGWVMPGSAAMEIVMWNSRLDVGNVEKLLADSCSGLVFSDDRILTELHVLKRRDRGGERYVVTVRAIGEPAARIPDNHSAQHTVATHACRKAKRPLARRAQVGRPAQLRRARCVAQVGCGARAEQQGTAGQRVAIACHHEAAIVARVYKKWTVAEQQRLRDLWNDHSLTIVQIGKMLGRSKHSVWARGCDLGLPRHRMKAAWTPVAHAIVERAVDQLVEHYSERLGRSPAAVLNHLVIAAHSHARRKRRKPIADVGGMRYIGREDAA